MKFPNPFKLLGAIIVALWAHFRGYRTMATVRAMKNRYSICRRCSFSKNEQCQKCSCLIQAKISVATEKCPDGRWDREWVKRRGE